MNRKIVRKGTDSEVGHVVQCKYKISESLKSVWGSRLGSASSDVEGAAVMMK